MDDLLGQGQRDRRRYQEKIADALKKRLDKIITHENIITSPSGKKVRILVPDIHEPRFRFDSPKDGGKPSGVGSGDGDGTISHYEEEGQGQGQGAGSDHDEGTIGIDVPLEEAARWVFEELKLPMIEKRAAQNEEESFELTSKGKKGVILDKKKTLLTHRMRELATGKKEPWREDDLTYRRWHEKQEPKQQAAIVLVRDASGSITDEMQFIIRLTCFWVVLWLRENYPKTVVHFVLHDTDAIEVTEDEFFQTRTMGGTYMSSGLILAEKILDEQHPFDSWNRYIIHATDFDNWEGDYKGFRDAVNRLLDKLDLLAFINLTNDTNSTTWKVLDALVTMGVKNLKGACVPTKDGITYWLKHVFGENKDAKLA